MFIRSETVWERGMNKQRNRTHTHAHFYLVTYRHRKRERARHTRRESIYQFTSVNDMQKESEEDFITQFMGGASLIARSARPFRRPFCLPYSGAWLRVAGGRERQLTQRIHATCTQIHLAAGFRSLSSLRGIEAINFSQGPFRAHGARKEPLWREEIYWWISLAEAIASDIARGFN